MPVTPVLLSLLLALVPGASLRVQRPRSAEAQLPPVSWTCPMHPDVVEDRSGKCSICGMALEPVRLDSIWSCPIHTVVEEAGPGTCPVCQRPLMRVTVALAWTCAGPPVTKRIEPGVCPDGSQAVMSRLPRPHGNHNPQHGGQFFMAPDNWHHLEGVYPEPGVFRVYVYDDYSRPLSAGTLTRASGRVETKDKASFPLMAAEDRPYLQAQIGTIPVPAQLVARIRFEPGAAEHRFDFTFTEWSRDPETTPPPASVPSNPQNATAIDAALVALPIPDSIPGILEQLRARNVQVRDFIARGDLARAYFPAFQAKDLALALLERTTTLPPERHRRLETAVTRLVRAAWVLDANGDVGNRDEMLKAYEAFAAAVADVETTVGR